MHHPQQHHKRAHTQCAEPIRLPVRRSDGKIQERTGLIPHPAVIASHHAEAVLAGSRTGIERLPPSVGVLPIAIPALQLVTEVNLVRRDQAERCVINHQVADQRRQPRARGGRIAGPVLPVGLAVGGDLFDVHRRRKFVEGKVTRIDDADAVVGQELQLSIG